MKTILILSDTLNRHFLPAYGNDWVKTPNIDRLAARSVTFDNHWLGSAPCMPARRDILTGRLNFMEKAWGGMEPFDRPLTRILRENGIFSHMVTDHYHYFHPGGENYHADFNTWELIRGQELDCYTSLCTPPERPERIGRWNPQYAENNASYEKEEDYPTPRTFQSAVNWLKNNEDADDYFLWVEAFDPHEPFDVPDEYLELYGDDWDGPVYNWPRYDFIDEEKFGETPEAVAHLRRRYAAGLTMMDRWLGKLLDEVERQNGLEDTMIIFTTDHGFMLGEHNCTGKNEFQCWNEQAHLPLIVHLPGSEHAGERRSQLTQNIDIMPTLLDLYGLEAEVPMQGESWMPILNDNAPAQRIGALYGYYGKSINWTDGKHTYFRSPANENNQPIYQYFLSTFGNSHHNLMGLEHYERAELGRFLPYTDYPVLKTPHIHSKAWYDCGHFKETLLFDIEKDYAQTDNLAGTDLETACIEQLKEEMKKHEAPAEQYERLGIK